MDPEINVLRESGVELIPEGEGDVDQNADTLPYLPDDEDDSDPSPSERA